jgi:DNA-binding PadR family transcriptional regulator
MLRDPQRFVPLRPVEFLVLVSLAEGDLHGYGLTQAIDERSDGAVRLEPGNLYKVLKRLVADGLIESAGHRPAADLENERRHYYRLTRLGERVVALEARRIAALVASPAVRSLVKRFAPAT